MMTEAEMNMDQARKYRTRAQDLESKASRIEDETGQVRQEIQDQIVVVDEVFTIGENVPRGTRKVFAKSNVISMARIPIDMASVDYVLLPTVVSGEKHGMRWIARLDLSLSKNTMAVYLIEEV